MTEQDEPITASGSKMDNSHPDTDLISLLARRVARTVAGQSRATHAIVLDEGLLRPGDHAEAKFEKSLIFFPNNLGASLVQQFLAKEVLNNDPWPVLSGPGGC